jgi:hypothetical protein
MNRQHALMSALALVVGCATASPAIVETGPARAGALACARDMLSGGGYEVRIPDPDTSNLMLEAEVRHAYPPNRAVREIITVELAEPAEAEGELQITVRAWYYQPSEHSLPIHRQSATEVRPSDEAVQDARQVLVSCAAPTSEHAPTR